MNTSDLTGLVDTITAKPAKTIMLGSALLGVFAALSGVGNVIDKWVLNWKLGLDINLDTPTLVKRGALFGAVVGAPFAYMSAAGIVYDSNPPGLGIAQAGKHRVLNDPNRVADYHTGRMTEKPSVPDNYQWVENPNGASYLIVDPKYKL